MGRADRRRHGAIARGSSGRAASAPARQAELERLRAELVAGDSPDDLAALVAADSRWRCCRCGSRRASTRSDLLVRVYPDTLHVDTHEPELTADELPGAGRYLEREKRQRRDRPRDARGVARAGRPLRGAARRLDRPRRGRAGHPPQRAAAWTRAARTNVLPDRWIALGYRGGERRFAVLGRPIPDALAPRPRPERRRGGRPGGAARPRGAVARRLRPRRRARHGAADPARRGRPPPASTGSSCSACARPPTAPRARAASRRCWTPTTTPTGSRSRRPGTPTNNTETVRSAWTPAGDDSAVSLRNERGAALTTSELGRHAARARARDRAPTRSRHAAGAGGGADRAGAPDAHRAVAGDVGLHARPARRRALRRRDRRGPRALPRERGGRRRAARRCGSAASRTACWRSRRSRAGGCSIRPTSTPRCRAAAQRPRARVARGADPGAARRARRGPRRRAGRRGRDEPGVGPLRRARRVAPGADAATFARLAQALAPIRALGLPLDPALARRRLRAGSSPPLTGPLVADAAVGDARRCPPAQSYVTWLAFNGLDTRAHRRAPGRREHAAVRAAAPRAAARVRDAPRCASSAPAGSPRRARATSPGLADGTPPSPWARLGRAAGRRDRGRADARRAPRRGARRPTAPPARPRPPSSPS